MRPTLAAIVVACAAVPAVGQPPLVPIDGKVTIPLTVSPAAAMKPASRYLLQPQYTDIRPGEKLSGFLKCFMEQHNFFNAENEAKRDEWNKLPLAELPLETLRGSILDGIAYDPPYARLMTFMDQAARYDRVEWNIWHNLRRDGAHTLIPEVQQPRTLANVLKLRMRAEIKAGEFARAIETSKTLFGLARMYEQHPTLIGYLVGAFVATIAVDALEEMVQQPGCPNIYWGLTELGSPVLDLRLGTQGERIFLTEQLRQLVEATGPVSDADMAKHLKMLDALVATERRVGKDDATPASDKFKAMAADPKRVEEARAILIDAAARPEHVKTFPPLQAIVTADLRRYEEIRDEHLKLVALPLWQMQPLARAADEELTRLKEQGKLVLAPSLVAAVAKVRATQARLDQRVAYLRVIEAIRLHAHESGGKLPGSLNDIKLPLPIDPVNGLQFTYAVRNGEVGLLNGANPRPDDPVTHRHYEIRIRK